MALDPEVSTLVFWLGYEMDSGAGTSRVLLTLGSSGETAAPVPAPSLEELAGRLASLDFTGLDSGLVHGSLERSVDTARYWQGPDGEDVLAGLPAITAALSPVAEQLMAFPDIQWWGQSRRVEQWAIDWDPGQGPAPWPQDPGRTLRQWGRTERAEEARAVRELPDDLRANVSGSWWSLPHGMLRTVGHLPAGLGLVEDSLGWEQAVTVPVGGAGRILEIRTAEDWSSLCWRFPLEVTASRRHDWFRATGYQGRWVIPDWERVADEWDAVHLTVLGYLNGATRALPVDTNTATVIAGWDPDSTLWLTDAARETGGPRQTWRRASNRGPWTPVPD
ncbi:hypothetical protein ACQCSX_20880 (plasmid) [Pseudarthrobacter sp. P1]|uniref:hypothetical protein n=1 Tax=Pseudarthrobacter sp. P1 TaxID=3418418 RepID=UPI003CF24A7A